MVSAARSASPPAVGMEPPAAAADLTYARCQIPEASSGVWCIEHFEVSDNAAEPSQVDDVRPDWVRAAPGTYTRLRCDGVDYMSDLYEEWHSQEIAMRAAVERGGDVLITGLGLGMIADTILRCDSAIRSVTVIDASEDVIRLVAPHMESAHSDRLRIVHADAFTWRPPEGTRYTTAWHDIWPSPFEQRAVDESHQLFDHYAPWAEWQGSWTLEYRRLAGLGT